MNSLETKAFGFGIIVLIIFSIIAIISQLWFTGFFVANVMGISWWSMDFYLASIGMMAILGGIIMYRLS